MTAPKRLYSVAETAAQTDLSRAQTYIEIREGRLRSVKVGRRRLVPAEAIDAWLAALDEH